MLKLPSRNVGLDLTWASSWIAGERPTDPPRCSCQLWPATRSQLSSRRTAIGPATMLPVRPPPAMSLQLMTEIQPRWVRTDHASDLLNSLEHCLLSFTLARSDERNWKWCVSAAHSVA